MNQRVLLFVDNSKRDLLATRLIELELNKRGVQTMLCNHFNWRVSFRRFRPHGFVSSRGNHEFARKASECCRVYVVPSEGNRLTKETMLSVFLGRSYFKVDKIDWIRKCYLWNENTYKWLLECDFKPEQLKVVGNVRLDPYRHPFYNKKVLKNPSDFVLGVAFSAKSTSTYYGHPHFAEVYYRFHPEETYPIVNPGRHHEDIVWRDHAILRHAMRVIRKYLENTPGKIAFRPGPFEDPREYAFLKREFPDRVTILPNQQLIDWVSGIDAMLTCWSTTGIEGLTIGVPVISISGLMDQQHLFNHINAKASGFESFVNFYHSPVSDEEMLALFDRAMQGTLPVSVKSDNEVRTILHDMYDWPYEQDTCVRIAQDIADDLQDAIDVSDAQWRQVFPLPYGLPVSLARFGYFAKAMKDYVKSGAFGSNFDFHRTSDPRVEAVIKKMS